MSEKINLWRMEEMLKKLNTSLIAVTFIKLDLSFEKFDENKKYNKKNQVLFNDKAFYNAYKKVTGKNVKKLKSAITKLKHSIKTDQVLFNKEHAKLGKIIDANKIGYDRFDLSFDDVLFSPQYFIDERMKQLAEKQNPKKDN